LKAHDNTQALTEGN